MQKITKFDNLILEVMSGLSIHAFDGALPYLSLTSKFENGIRDFLAFRPHKRFQEQGWFAIAREKTFAKKKVDIAIFERGQHEMFELPVTIIELKAVAEPMKIVTFLEGLGNDLIKAKENLRHSQADANPTYLGLL